MKILFEYCTQSRAYADSHGKCLVLVEDGDDKEAIKADFEKPRNWYEQSYIFSRELNEYTFQKYDGDVVYKGNLLLFDTTRPYLD